MTHFKNHTFVTCSIQPSIFERLRIIYLKKICKFLYGIYLADTIVDISAYRANVQSIIVSKILLRGIFFLYQPSQGIAGFLSKRQLRHNLLPPLFASTRRIMRWITTFDTLIKTNNDKSGRCFVLFNSTWIPHACAILRQHYSCACLCG